MYIYVVIMSNLWDWYFLNISIVNLLTFKLRIINCVLIYKFYIKSLPGTFISHISHAIDFRITETLCSFSGYKSFFIQYIKYISWGQNYLIISYSSPCIVLYAFFFLNKMHMKNASSAENLLHDTEFWWNISMLPKLTFLYKVGFPNKFSSEKSGISPFYNIYDFYS